MNPNTVTLTLQSSPDKAGKQTFICQWTERGVLAGPRHAQYHGKVEEHCKFWRDKRGREVRVVEYMAPMKKGRRK